MSDIQSAELAASVWTRRGFMGALGLLAANACFGSGTAPLRSPIDTWRDQFAGRSVSRTDTDYESWRQSMPWQMHTAPRYPDLITRPNSAAAVSDVIGMASKSGQRLAIKSGGHNVSEAFLRDGGVLLDLGELQGITVDSAAKTAWIEPALWSHGVLRALEPHGFAFPVAHCATVPMGGFLLGGGLGYNHDNWGTLACHSVLAAEVVLASGETVIASPKSHPDLYWAVRGAGTGFFGVVTRYLVQLYPAPDAVYESSYIFPLSKLDEATRLLLDWADSNPVDTEIMMLLAHNPMAGPDTPPLESKMCIARAVTFANGKQAAQHQLTNFASHPLTENAIMKNEMVATSLEQMQVDSVNANMGLGFGHYAVDTIWTDRLPEVMRAIRDVFLSANSTKTHFVISPKCNRALSEDAAFSVIGDAFVGAYTMWDEGKDTEASFRWLRTASDAMRPLATGQYINEVDAFSDPSAPQRCFSRDSWKRLETLRSHYDPNRLFHSWPGTS